MTERQNVLWDFIQTFLKKARTNRRHSKNTILNLTDIINQACNSQLDKSFDYSEDEILEGFYKNGFLILEPKDKNVLTASTKKGPVVFSNGNHINVNSQDISDLVCSLRKGFPLESNPDTILRINKCKETLKQFANKHRISIVHQSALVKTK